MQTDTLEYELGKRMEFVTKWSKQGDKRILIIPTEHHGTIEKMKRDLKVTVEEILG